MSKKNLRRILTPAAVAAFLFLTSAADVEAVQRFRQESASLVEIRWDLQLWGLLNRVGLKIGSRIDPDGRNTKIGSRIDPDGLRTNTAPRIDPGGRPQPDDNQ